ncbi:MAG: DJ-1/PfpI family protein [Leptospira sp.]|nr:DJ-1/PfpI family protein [Leptospira sp.]
MKLAYILFNDITLLDFIGIYDPVSRLKSMKFIPDLEWDLCSFEEGVRDSFGLEIKTDKIRNDLSEYDAIIIPGGLGTRKLQFDQEFISWLKTAKDVPLKISICTGSLLLGACGFLKGRKATTNFQEYEALKKYCDNVLEVRIVDDNDIITAGAVSASIDLGLYLCKKWSGGEAQDQIRKRMDYHG